MSDNFKPEQYGRRLITTDVPEITDENIIGVLQMTYAIHLANRKRMQFLLDYEKGNQPLQRKKTIRPEIDINVCDNVANEVSNFRLSYKWGNPITFAQRADEDIEGSNPNRDNKAITMLNEMLSQEGFSSKCVEAFYPMEVAGLGFMMVDIKKDFVEGSTFDIVPLNPLNTFVVYDNTVFHRRLMGVSYIESDNGDVHFTCLTKDKRYEIQNLLKITNAEKGEKKEFWGFGQRSGEKNPMGCVNIVEFARSYDRMGCFERQLSDMDNLNILVSDFTNNVSQDTQAIWWMNDADFPVDPKTGETVTPKSNQWVLTKTGTGENKKPLIQALVVQTDYEGILADIQYRRNIIMQKCNVPTTASLSGGSTGTAMSMASGWEAAETSAAMETELVKSRLMDLVDLVLIAVRESTDTPKDSLLRGLRTSDIKPSVLRKKNYDMATKANTYATLIKNGIHPRHAMLFIEAFADPNLVYTDSIPYLDKYMDKMWTIGNGGKAGSDNTTLQDESDQATNSPFINGTSTSTGGRNVGSKESVEE